LSDNDLRIDLLHIFIGKAQPPDYAWCEILDQHIELRDHRHHEFARTRMLQVDCEAQFAVIVLHVIGAVAATLGGARLQTPVAHAITAGRQFQLHDLRSELGHQTRAGRPCDILGKI
jgi:hypothetical protein